MQCVPYHELLQNTFSVGSEFLKCEILGSGSRTNLDILDFDISWSEIYNFKELIEKTSKQNAQNIDVINYNEWLNTLIS